MDPSTRATHQAALDGLRCLPSDAAEDVRRYHAARDARATARAALDAALVTRDPRTIERACEEHGAAVEEYHDAALQCACDLAGAVRTVEDAERALATGDDDVIVWTPGATRAA